MRILFDSKNRIFKEPFGTVSEGQACTLNVHSPAQVGCLRAECILRPDDGGETVVVPMSCTAEKGPGHGPENLDSGISSNPDRTLPKCSSSSDLSFVNCKMKGWPTDFSSSLQCR